MAKGHPANNKKTPQGVANVEVILFNHLMQERWKKQTEQWKSKQSYGKDFISSEMANQRIYDLRIIAISFVENL
jgi:hypothetical protein